MFRLITLFSLSLLLIAFSQIKKEFDLRVEISSQRGGGKAQTEPTSEPSIERV